MNFFFNLYTIAKRIITLTIINPSDQTVLSCRLGFFPDSSQHVLASAGNVPAWECHAGRKNVENGVAQPGDTCGQNGSISYTLVKKV